MGEIVEKVEAAEKDKKKRRPGKLAVCPVCREKMPVQKKNPYTCINPTCNTRFNMVVRTIPIHLADFDQARMEEVFRLFHQAGQWFMKALKARKNQWHIIEKEKGVCLLCKKEKSLVFQHEGEHICSACGSDRLYGVTARKELIPLARQALPHIVRATMFDSAFRRAESLFKKWLSDNWGPFIGEAKRHAFFEECKERARVFADSTEKPQGQKKKKGLKVLENIRSIWANSRTPQCVLQFFQTYVRGRRINQRYRTPRRKSLQKISMAIPRPYKAGDSKRKAPRRKPSLPKLAFLLAKPICGSCPHLEVYEWGPECKMHNWRLNPPPTQYPAFPSTIVSMQKETYKVSRQEMEVYSSEKILPEHMELYLLEKGVKDVVQVLGTEWLETYGYPNFETSVYPQLWRRDTGREAEYYLLYTKTEFVLLKQGPWTHIVACGPTVTCVASMQNNELSQVRYFGHGRILAIKEYHSQQRKRVKSGNGERKVIIKAGHLSHKRLQEFLVEARKNGPSIRLQTLEAILAERESGVSKGKERKIVLFRGSKPARPVEESKGEEKSEEDILELPLFRKMRRSGFSLEPRVNEKHEVGAILHNESRDIADYLAPMHGTVVLLGMDKQQYTREDTSRKEFNQRLSRWPEARLRELLIYKLFLEGFEVQSEKFDLQALAVCSLCGREAGGTWQDLIVVKNYHSIKCVCGADTNTMLGIAQQAVPKQEVAQVA